MFNTFNALSENQSLLVVGPFTNLWVLVAVTLSFLLHFMILYVPFFTKLFMVHAIGYEEWKAVILFSFPVILIDEVLKFFSRTFLGGFQVSKEKKD